MIIFYPRKREVWNHLFDFHPTITLEVKAKTNHMVFRNRADLIEFLGAHDVDLADPNFPLRFESAIGTNEDVYGYGDPYVVVQKQVLGWFRDDYK